MTNDTERREVAWRLREINPYRNQSYTIPCNRYIPAVEYLSELAGALGYSPRNDVSRLEFQNRLADLIEPESERTCRMEYAGEVPPSVRYSCYFCSECGSPIYNDMEPSYCPYCGAKVVDNGA